MLKIGTGITRKPFAFWSPDSILMPVKKVRIQVRSVYDSKKSQKDGNSHTSATNLDQKYDTPPQRDFFHFFIGCHVLSK